MKRENGVTMISLVVTIIVLLILAGISIQGGTGIIKRAQLEEIKTNMLLIQAKSKGLVEDASFKMGINPDDVKKNEVRQNVYVEGAKLEKAENVPTNFNISDTANCYWLTSDAQANWGLDKIELKSDEKYLIQFNEEEEKVEVYNTIGHDGKYSLSQLNNEE